MEMVKIRKQLETLKIHVDMLQQWMEQATNVIYTIEENILDHEEKEWFDKYIKNTEKLAGV